MTAPKVSLAQQIEALHLAASRQRSLASGTTVKEMRPRAAAEYDTQRLGAAIRTLEWLQVHEVEIKAYLALPPAVREAGLAMAAEIERKRAIAAAGGPAR